MDLGLLDRTAAVAAGTTGLGYAVALELAREGARVVVASRSPERVASAVESISVDAAVARHCGRRVSGVAADLSRPDGAAALADEARRCFGRVDIAIANCGGPPAGAALAVGDLAWQAGFELTFLSASRLVQATAPAMKQAGWGRIVFITSVSVKQPIPDLAISTSLRSAVTGYAKSLSDELAAFGVTVNCVAPGSTLTGRLTSLLERRAADRGMTPADLRVEEEARIPARRFGRPEEFAAAVAFLASERASYITGTVLAVDGGVVRSLT